MSGAAPLCCACGAPAPGVVERHRDRHAGVEYALHSCDACGLVFAEPRAGASAEWYAAAVPLEPAAPAEKDPRFSWLLDRLPRGARILDVGCGEGPFLRLAAARGFPAVGFDWDARRTAVARAAGLDARTEDWDSFCASRPPGEFGAVALFDVLEHAPEPAPLLRRARRLLAPGGLLAVTLPNAERPLPFGRENYDYPPHHFTRWTAASLARLLAREGYEVVLQESPLRDLRAFHEVMVAQCALRPAVRLAKRVLFGAAADDGATLTELYAAESSAAAPALGKRARSALFSAYAAAAGGLLWPAAAALGLWYRASRRAPGPTLRTLARKP